MIATRQGVPDVSEFVDGVVAEYGQRLPLLCDGGDRRAVEDGMALLRGVRTARMDVRAFEVLLGTLCCDRAPDGVTLLKPRAIGHELARRWDAYRAQGGLPATD